MTITEKVSYLKGLMEGLSIDSISKEGKVFHAILDTLQEMALSIEENSKVIDDMTEAVEMIDDDLTAVEDMVYGDDEDDFDFDDDEDDDDIYEVTCPECGKTFKVSEDMLDDGETVCPSCGQSLEFDLQIDQPSEGSNDAPIRF
jgi:putative FmdB family regulatory protein